MIGRRLGHFRIEAQIGAGGMGIVYRALDENLGRSVALKVLPSGALSDEASRRRFRQEAMTLARLSHAHIGQVFDFGSEGEVDFLAMELIQGESLVQRLERGPLEEADLLRLGQQLASALQCAHETGIIHRDLKPANLMLTSKGDLKVLDFGLAKLLEFGDRDGSTRALTEAHAVTGTLPYMAPEQLRDELVDARTDIWAVGVVLFELATGRRPFEGEVLPKLTDAILHSKPPSSRTLNPRLSEGLAAIIQRCLEKDADRRFSTAAELKASLQSLSLEHMHPVRKTRHFWIAGTLATIIACLFLWGVARKGGAVDIRSLAVLPLANLSGDPAQDYFADGMTDVLITELSRVKSLKVISRTSSMRFKGSKLSLPEIAKALGVEGVIEGSVTRSGGKVRVNAQLIRAASDEHLWADLFERKEEDVLALHREIAQAIAGRVQVALSSDEAGHLKQARKVNPEAFDLVLQGRYLLGHIGNPNDLPRVIRLFEKALTMDPESVEAHAGLANALSAWAAWGFGDYWDLFPRIEKEVDAALALDPNHSWALLAKADLRYAKGDAKGSAELCRRASERDPGNALALSLVGWHLDTQEGDPRGEELQKKALELDPLSQGLRCNYMTTLYCKRKFPEAEAQARKILDLDPTWFYAHDTLRRLHLRAGRLSEAQEASRKAWKPVFGDSFNPPPGLSWPVYDRWLEQFLLKQPRTFIPIWLADIHLYRGDRAKALAYLEEAAKANKVVASMAFGYPDWDPIRDDPRFQVLVEKQGLPVTLYCRTPGK